MVIIELIRLEESEFGTIGILKVDKKVLCWTLEPPDVENQTNKSSIPEQQYICKRINSPKYGKTFQVTDVPGRTNVLFHKGNVVDHTKGCIILGERVGRLGVQRAVLNSGKTFKSFMKLLSGQDEFHLTISKNY